MTPYTTKAEYREQIIPEYQGNPLLEVLPDIWPSDHVVQMLSEKQLIIMGNGSWTYSTGCIASTDCMSSLWSSTLILNSAYPGTSVKATCTGTR